MKLRRKSATKRSLKRLRSPPLDSLSDGFNLIGIRAAFDGHKSCIRILAEHLYISDWSKHRKIRFHPMRLFLVCFIRTNPLIIPMLDIESEEYGLVAKHFDLCLPGDNSTPPASFRLTENNEKERLWCQVK